MGNVYVKDRNLFQGECDVFCPVEPDCEYKVLDPSDEELLSGAAECLAETFAGISVDGVRISEPMTNACLLSAEDMFDFTRAYLKSVAYQRLCYAARDTQTGKVMGAVACEDFDPADVPPVFEGSLSPMNTIISFLSELDDKFFRAIESKTGRAIAGNEYVHAFMAGSRLGALRRFAIIKLLDLLIKDARAREYKGIFVEATNNRSAKLLTDYCGFHQVYGSMDEPIQSAYGEHEVFKSIPPSVATECRILYKPLFPGFDI